MTHSSQPSHDRPAGQATGATPVPQSAAAAGIPSAAELADTKTFVPDAADVPGSAIHDQAVAPWATNPVSDDAPGPSGPAQPEFGRYQVTDLLGEGGYGRVYRGYDPELRRAVAIKVPRRERIATPDDAEAYLTEARVVAGLDHVGIVPVHDVGRSADGLCYVVSKFMPGGDLARRIERNRPSYEEAAELVARVAEALSHAHQRGLVHRDIKPQNILLDEAGHPLVADFGLALADEDFGGDSTYCGTPAYMSPEQARGEGHRVDARSDVYSLGVVLYELLAGRQPYRHPRMPELLDEITRGEIRPPRQLDNAIPKELERIALKALAKRAADRYTTALDLADDLRHWQAKRKKRKWEQVTGDRLQSAQGKGERERRGRGETEAEHAENLNPNLQPLTPAATPVTPPDSDPLGTPRSAIPARVVPKGLRSFDAHDADFFLQLLPGPTDRDGLPESIRFWKTRVEQTDADQTFSVGLVYGPSGCGKSSLIKAGVLPRLGQHVLAVYLEATPDDTEARLLKGLRKAVGQALQPDVAAGHADAAASESQAGKPDLQNLVDLLAALRHGRGLAPGQKLLIVLDQFEQWLHSHDDPGGTELVRALRQCDGAHAQAIVMVRDDFWMAGSEFLRELEIPLLEGENSAAVYLFDLRHARKVLALFGRALGCLGDVGELTPEQEQFLDQAVAGLAEKEKVVSVRLALFAEMVKGKPWTPATLVAIGGITGVGATFLEETFSESTAPPRHRLHQRAARGVLRALLPEAGADIKGQMKSHAELLSASGYERRPADFAELLRILDAELRLITPADEGGRAEGDRLQGTGDGRQNAEQASSDSSFIVHPSSFYQLTHDYLVPSLRRWLTRKQRETRRGRAELRLDERSALWNAKPENSRLPGGLEYLNIRLLTRPKSWTEP